jgi:beta-phosphoglucomutase
MREGGRDGDWRVPGAIFDVDGVLVDSPHEMAWREGLKQLMEGEWSDIRGQTSWSPEAFTPQVYQREMSGKTRFKGSQAALEYFDVPDVERRTKEYGDRKQAMIVELIEAKQFEEYPDALRFVLKVKEAGILIAAASSSKNAGAFLRLVRLDEFAEREGLSYSFLRPGYTLLDILDGDVSGRDFERGKPDPDIFLAAAEELGLTPAECFVVEDAANGIQAAKAGEMAALGIARADDEEALAEAGADLVVTSLDEVSIEALSEGRLEEVGIDLARHGVFGRVRGHGGARPHGASRRAGRGAHVGGRPHRVGPGPRRDSQPPGLAQEPGGDGEDAARHTGPRRGGALGGHRARPPFGHGRLEPRPGDLRPLLGGARTATLT